MAAGDGGALGAARPTVFGTLIKPTHKITLNHDKERKGVKRIGEKWGQGQSELLGNTENQGDFLRHPSFVV